MIAALICVLFHRGSWYRDQVPHCNWLKDQRSDWCGRCGRSWNWRPAP
jgi:hypothetical protein